jgi:hypothetical protein
MGASSFIFTATEDYVGVLQSIEQKKLSGKMIQNQKGYNIKVNDNMTSPDVKIFGVA